MSISEPTKHQPHSLVKAREVLATPLTLLLTDNNDSPLAGDRARAAGKLVSETDTARYGTTGDVWVVADAVVWMSERNISLGSSTVVLNLLADTASSSSSAFFGDPLTAGRESHTLRPSGFILLEVQDSEKPQRLVEADVNLGDIQRNSDLDHRLVCELEHRAQLADATDLVVRTSDRAFAIVLGQRGYVPASVASNITPYVFRRLI